MHHNRVSALVAAFMLLVSADVAALEAASAATVGEGQRARGATASQAIALLQDGGRAAGPFYDRDATATWALSHARDVQRNGALCTVFASRALWAGGFKPTSAWHEGTDPAKWVEHFVEYLRSNYDSQWVDISSRFRTNAVAEASLGDVIVYDWEADGTLDHLAVVSDIAPNQYPEVSEWGTLKNFGYNDRYGARHIDYAKRGWTWSEIDKVYLQKKYPRVRAYLLHLNSAEFGSGHY